MDLAHAVHGGSAHARALGVADDSTFRFRRSQHASADQRAGGSEHADLSDLEPAWSLAFPGVATLRAQPAIVGNTLFLNVGDNAKVFALDISGAAPCIQWTYTSDVPTRSGIGFGTMPRDGRKVIVFNDVATQIHLVDATTGKLIWKQHVGLYDLSNTTGAPVILGDRVYVPLSASEINIGGDDKHLCCKTHGGFFALDLRTGKKLWTLPHDGRSAPDPRSWRRADDVGPLRRADLDVAARRRKARAHLRGHR